MQKQLPTVKEASDYSQPRSSGQFRGLNLDEGFAWIESRTNFESRQMDNREYRLDRMRKIMSVIGNPERSLRIIHIAGSKGKGSTAVMTAYILDAAGFRTSLYTSPHVMDYRERFRIINEDCPEEILISAINRLHQETVSSSGALYESGATTFELLTAVFFLMSYEAGCDYAVVETGLGGRLDATNIIIRPQVSICTSIELEHTEILGETLEEIASEKAGIIKKGCPICIGNLPPEADMVFQNHAQNAGSQLYRSRDTIQIIKEPDAQTADIRFSDGFTIKAQLKLLGTVQFENAALACLAIRTILPGILTRTYEKGLACAEIYGRMQLLSGSPPIIIDGGHTPSSIERNLEAIRTVMPGGGVLIFGAVDGKNIAAMAELLSRIFMRVIICRPGTFRPSNPEKTAELFSCFLPEENITIVEDGHIALQDAIQSASAPDQGVCVMGSFYLAGKILKAYKESRNNVVELAGN